MRPAYPSARSHKPVSSGGLCGNPSAVRRTKSSRKSRLTAFLAGAATAYLLDPADGRRRRHVLRDRSARLLRRTGRTAGKRSRFALGHLRGVAARARGIAARPERATDDRTVEQRIRSDALREAGVTTSDVDVQVEDGVAVLRGKVPERSLADDLVKRVRKVPGVAGVSDQLEVEGPGRTEEQISVT